MKKVTKLTLSKETIKHLEERLLLQIAGGLATNDYSCVSCLGQPCPYK
jgi:natural product precursor